MRLKSAIVSLCLFILCATAHGDEPQPLTSAETELALAGSVGDGPVANARITVRSRTGTTLQNLISSNRAGYAIVLRTADSNYPLELTATGGTDLVTDKAPDVPLTSAVPAPLNNAVANINPFATLAVATAKRRSGGLTASNLQSAMNAVIREFNSGLTTLATNNPMTTRITDTNLAEIVKASETLAEVWRRTNTAILGAGRSSSVSSLVNKLAADLTDGRLNGRGSSGVDPYASAVTTIVGTKVLIEAMTNQLRVNGTTVTSALDATINELASRRVDKPTSKLTVTASMIERAKIGVAAALAIAPSNELRALQTGLNNISPGMGPNTVGARLPSGSPRRLDPAISTIRRGSAAHIEAVNTISGGGTAPAPTQPAPSSGSATLTWQPPTQNTNGTPLNDLAGYRIYWGTSSRNYSNSVTVNNAGLTSYVVSSLSPRTWYFAVKALNKQGVESNFSNEASKTIQ